MLIYVFRYGCFPLVSFSLYPPAVTAGSASSEGTEGTARHLLELDSPSFNITPLHACLGTFYSHKTPLRPIWSVPMKGMPMQFMWEDSRIVSHPPRRKLLYQRA